MPDAVRESCGITDEGPDPCPTGFWSNRPGESLPTNPTEALRSSRAGPQHGSAGPRDAYAADDALLVGAVSIHARAVRPARRGLGIYADPTKQAAGLTSIDSSDRKRVRALVAAGDLRGARLGSPSHAVGRGDDGVGGVGHSAPFRDERGSRPFDSSCREGGYSAKCGRPALHRVGAALRFRLRLRNKPELKGFSLFVCRHEPAVPVWIRRHADIQTTFMNTHNHLFFISKKFTIFWTYRCSDILLHLMRAPITLHRPPKILAFPLGFMFKREEEVSGASYSPVPCPAHRPLQLLASNQEGSIHCTPPAPP